jgi:hypothetical protein
MMTRRRAREIVQLFLASVEGMDRDKVLLRWALPERGGVGLTEVVELRDEASGHAYMRTVTATLLPNGSIVVGAVILPPESAYRRNHHWLPRQIDVILAIGPRWLFPVAKTLILKSSFRK